MYTRRPLDHGYTFSHDVDPYYRPMSRRERILCAVAAVGGTALFVFGLLML